MFEVFFNVVLPSNNKYDVLYNNTEEGLGIILPDSVCPKHAVSNDIHDINKRKRLTNWSSSDAHYEKKSISLIKQRILWSSQND